MKNETQIDSGLGHALDSWYWSTMLWSKCACTYSAHMITSAVHSAVSRLLAVSLMNTDICVILSLWSS